MVNTEYCTEYFFCSDVKLIETIGSALDIISDPNGLTYSSGQTDEAEIEPFLQCHVDAYAYYIKVSFVFCNEYRLDFKWSDYTGKGHSDVKHMTISIHDERSDNPGIWIDGKPIDVKPIALATPAEIPSDLETFLTA